MIRIVVIEDHPLITDGLRNRFRPSRDGIEVVAGISSVREALGTLGEDAFDIIILDLWLPGSEPMDNVALLKEHFPGKPVVILTSEDSPYWEHMMMKAGVKAYLIKNADRARIKKTIVAVASGETILPDLNFPKVDSDLNEDPVLRKYHMKPSEKEIIMMFANGKSQKEIAAEKGLTVSAIQKVLNKLRKKYDVKSNAEVIHLLTSLKQI